jgi:hypothetical protein
MNFRKLALTAIGGLLALVVVADVASAADRPYAEGSVLSVSSIRTEPGMFDSYMEWLDGPWKQFMEARKSEGQYRDRVARQVEDRSRQRADPRAAAEISRRNNTR